MVAGEHCSGHEEVVATEDARTATSKPIERCKRRSGVGNMTLSGSRRDDVDQLQVLQTRRRCNNSTTVKAHRAERRIWQGRHCRVRTNMKLKLALSRHGNGP